MASSPEQPKKLGKSETAALTCRGCGKIGVSICAKCAKRGYPRVVARANPLRNRDPELYKRLDDLSRCSPDDNKPMWDEFIVEIGAGQHYEHLPILVEIIREGQWRTNALCPLQWIRGNFDRRVERVMGKAEYEPTPDGPRRLPNFRVFDKRSGSLIKPGIQPFCEFEYQNKEGETYSRLDDLGSDDELHEPLAANQEDWKALKKMSITEWQEVKHCIAANNALKEDKREFDVVAALVAADLRGVALRVGLGDDERFVLALKRLLGGIGARSYLKYVNGERKKRLRNAFDRFERKLKKPEWSMLLRETLKDEARKSRKREEAKSVEWFWDDVETDT